MFNVDSGKRTLTVSTIHQGGKFWPFIRLQGKWLQRLGFEAESKIEVEYSPGLLRIRLVPKVPCGIKNR